MRASTGQPSSDEDESEATPLIRNHPPPPPPPPLPRGQMAHPSPRRPPPAAARAPSPVPQTQQQPQQQPRQRQQQQATPRQQQPQQRQTIVAAQPPLPPPEGPPPPPPPPPPAICPCDWILKIRHPGRGMLRIHVPEGMTAYLLSKCIIQATNIEEDSVFGLFGYNSGVFVSLEHLISCSEASMLDDPQALHKQVYSLYIPAPLPLPPWWDDWRILGGGISLLVAILYLQLPNVLRMISAIPMAVENLAHQIVYYAPLFYHNLVTQPLKDTYRYGPSFFGGWEGVDLPTICARLTYGTEDFWQRNYKDCENMYLAKESAFLFVGRPLIFLVLLLIFIWILRQWLWYRALHLSDNRYQDRDMIQTYNAIQVLFRQINRMARINDHQYNRGGHRRND